MILQIVEVVDVWRLEVGYLPPETHNIPPSRKERILFKSALGWESFSTWLAGWLIGFPNPFKLVGWLVG